jgi:MYXO-CTERM domain-containing protein
MSMRRRFTSRIAAASVLAPLLLLPVSIAAHQLEPRTPVDWTGAPCMTTIDRSRTGPIVPLEYAIPHEDTLLTENEPLDGRRHQFFGFCRDHYFEDVMPNWISEADLQVALGLGIGDISLVDVEHDVLDNAERWQDCSVRINADDERRPITFEAAAEPVLWDTSELAAGTWVVEGYTWDPWFNLWTEHPGVFRIVDDPDPIANAPAAALNFDEQVVFVGEPASIGGCVEAMDGATMTLSWALGGTGVDPTWEVFAEDVPVQSGGFDLELIGPEAAVGRYLLVALEVVDPMARRWTAYSRHYIGVVAEPGGDEDESEGESESESESEGESESESDESETGPAVNEGSAGGCSCSTRERSSGAAVIGWLGALLLVGARRRRSAAAS